MKKIEIKKGIYWVGAIDWDIRNFHGYLTQRGTTYNSYLIIDDKITLIDTVKENLKNQLFDRIHSVIGNKPIDYIVCNHVEMDHSGALPDVMKKYKNAEIITCPNGKKGLFNHFYNEDWKIREITNSETIDLGKRKLDFFLTPMVHWPDNMVAYLGDEKLLFSNDAFGQHYATSERFANNVSLDIVFEEAKKYYANIVLPYGNQVQKVLNSLDSLDIDIIAPSHGLVWEKNCEKIINRYKDWSSNKTKKKAVIVYDTMWKSTEKIAFVINNALEENNYSIVVMNLNNSHVSDIMTEMIDAELLCIGSPTLNNNIMPNVAGFLAYLSGLAPKNRKAIVFGSYGWATKNVEIISEQLKNAGFEIITKVNQKFRPTENDLENIKKEIKEITK